VYAAVDTGGCVEIVTVRQLRGELAQVLDRVDERREHVVVTRSGRPVAVVVPFDEYEGLEETVDVLTDPELMRRLEESLAEDPSAAVPLAEVRRAFEERRLRPGA